MFNCWLLSVPIFILLQGGVYLWLSIWGLVLRECDQQVTDIARHPFKYIMELIYFYDSACGQPAVLLPGEAGVTSLNLSNGGEPTQDRTFIFLVSYLLISTLWILMSLWSIIIGSCTTNRNLKLLSFGTWFAAIMAGSILDAVATGYHINNLIHTTSANKTFGYLAINATTPVMDYIRGFDEYFVAPSIVMTCISSRVLLIWLLNLLGARVFLVVGTMSWLPWRI